MVILILLKTVGKDNGNDASTAVESSRLVYYRCHGHGHGCFGFGFWTSTDGER